MDYQQMYQNKLTTAASAANVINPVTGSITAVCQHSGCRG